MWVVLLIVILIVLALMFGGFQKGTKYSGLGAGPAHPDFGTVAVARTYAELQRGSGRAPVSAGGGRGRGRRRWRRSRRCRGRR